MTKSNNQLFYSRSVFIHAKSYRNRFNELINKATYLRQQCLTGESLLTGFTNVVGDIWFAFYYDDLTVHKQSIVEQEIHQTFLNFLLQTEEMNKWKLLTKYDELLSILTTSAFADQLLKWLQNNESATNAVIMHSSKSLNRLTQNVCNMLIVKSVTSAMEQQSSLQFLASINGKKIEQLPLTEQIALASSLQDNPLVVKIAEMTGKFKKIALKKQKSMNNNMARKDISVGQEISRLMPSELANYSLPSSKMDFLRKYAEQQTFIYGKQNKDTLGKGPIVICMDESSSMTSIKIESKAFCLALMHIARKQKRDLAVVPFASNVGEVQLFNKGQCSAEQFIRYSNAFLGGGTNYEKALSEALKIFQRSNFQRADLIFVTDGSSFLPTSFIHHFNEEKAKRKFKCLTIVLKNLLNVVDVSIVDRFSDRIIEVDELFEASDVFSI